MNVVYILQCPNGRYYIGSTNNLERRLGEHGSGKTKSLKYLLPIKLVFTQIFDTISEARKIESKLKKLHSREIIERIISDGYIKLK